MKHVLHTTIILNILLALCMPLDTQSMGKVPQKFPRFSYIAPALASIIPALAIICSISGIITLELENSEAKDEITKKIKNQKSAIILPRKEIIDENGYLFEDSNTPLWLQNICHKSDNIRRAYKNWHIHAMHTKPKEKGPEFLFKARDELKAALLDINVNLHSVSPLIHFEAFNEKETQLAYQNCHTALDAISDHCNKSDPQDPNDHHQCIFKKPDESGYYIFCENTENLTYDLQCAINNYKYIYLQNMRSILQRIKKEKQRNIDQKYQEKITEINQKNTKKAETLSQLDTQKKSLHKRKLCGRIIGGAALITSSLWLAIILRNSFKNKSQ